MFLWFFSAPPPSTTLVGSRPLPSKSFSLHYPPVILPLTLYVLGFWERRIVNHKKKKKSRFAVVCRVTGRQSGTSSLDCEASVAFSCWQMPNALLTQLVNSAFLFFISQEEKRDLGKRSYGLHRNSGNVDCKRGCHGALTWTKSKFSAELANIYLWLFPRETISFSTVQLLSRHLFLLEQLLLCF